jgi:autocrine motility factor receptor
MASLVICMELKRLFFDLKKRMKRHSNYLRVIEKMEKKFPWANKDELVYSDKCAVCWEKLDEARRLPCSHIFHHNCLRSWLEQDTSCPTCRKSLQDDKEVQQQSAATFLNTDPQQATAAGLAEQPQTGGAAATTATAAQQQPQLPIQQQQFTHRNLFHFDGSRYISWLPSFSLQVTNGGTMLPALLRSARANLEPERLNEMSNQVSQLFPHVPIDLIQHDLRQTHSVEITIENILEDRLNNPRNIQNMNNNNIINSETNTDDTDPDEDEDEYEENTSSEDDHSASHMASSSNSVSSNDNQRLLNRRRPNLFT